MRHLFPCLAVGALLITGCRDKQPETPRVPGAPAPMPKAESAVIPADSPAPEVQTTTAPGPVPHALQPVQDGIEAFKAKYGRLPFSVQEMMDKKILQQLPPLPPNRMYVIDHEMGQVRVTSNP